MKKRQLIFGLVFILLIASALFILSRRTGFQASEQAALNSQSFVSINDTSFEVELAVTDQQKSQGLSGRSGLAPNQGLLFLFDPAIQPTFWMKDMLFNIDLIWIKDGRVISVTRNAPAPQTGTELNELVRYEPPSEVDYVLEVTAGAAQQINVGDLFAFNRANSI